MDRRSFLRWTGVGSLSASAGCLGGFTPFGGGPTVRGIETGYPWLAAAIYDVDVEPVEDTDREAVPFESLPERVRVEFANAVHRGVYWTARPRTLLEEYHNDLVSYRDNHYEPGVGVGDRFTTEHGPENDPDWRDPVAVTVDAGRDELTVDLANELDVDLPVYHFGRPYFGVLVAVDDTVVVLDHDRYAANGHIRTGDFVTTEDPVGVDRQRLTLAPGDALGETYAVPDDLPDRSTVYLSLLVGGESIEQFPAPRTVITVTITLEA